MTNKNHSEEGFNLTTDCFETSFQNSLVGGKKLCFDFHAGRVSSDGGALLLSALDKRLELSHDLAKRLHDKRDPSRVQHSLEDLVRTRVLLIGLGYEDCNDADRLRHDPLLLAALGRLPEAGKGLPSQPTLSRFENGRMLEEGLRWQDLYRLSYVFLERFEKHYATNPPSQIVLDIDSTDDRTHGQQQLSFFNAYYDHECYLPYFIGATVDGKEEHFLGAVLRPGNSGTSTGALGILKRLVLRLKKTFRGVGITVRLDAGFSQKDIFEFCEAAGIKYVIRFRRNNHVENASSWIWAPLWQRYQQTQIPVCDQSEFFYQAENWAYPRRMLEKTVIDEEGMKLWYVITNYEGGSPQETYDFYSERGDFENRIKEMKLAIKSDRTSCSSFKANQFRLILYAASYLLFGELKRYLKGTALAHAQVETLRVKLLKLGALVKESVRRVWVQFSSHFVFQKLFIHLLIQIRGSTA